MTVEEIEVREQLDGTGLYNRTKVRHRPRND
jgi:hypothetical protein